MNEPYGQGFEPENNTFYASQGPDGVFSTNARYETLAEYTAKTFGWMFAGLTVTFLAALAGYASGIGILLISEELDEIMDLSDRIAVIYKGRIQSVLDRNEATRERLGILMAGVGEE